MESPRNNFIHEAELAAKNSPGASNPNKSLVLPSVPSYKMYPVNPPKIVKSSWILKKSNEPDPCSYKEVMKAFALTKSRVKTLLFGKSERNFFTNELLKKKEQVPGVGKY
jgi:hypothetical protein